MHRHDKLISSFLSLRPLWSENSYSIIRRGGVCLSSADELLLCRARLLYLSHADIFLSRGSQPLIKSSLIPFSAIILSQLLNGRDSIIPLIAHNPIGLQTWESLLLLHCCCSLPERLEKVWPCDECVYGLECLSGNPVCVGIPHTKGGLSNKYCWGQKQTVVKISASLQCLVLSYPLLSWPFSLCSLPISKHYSQHKLKRTLNTQLMTISSTAFCDRVSPWLLSTWICAALNFHLYLLLQYHRNQRNQGPLWWRLATALLSLLFDRGFIAGGGGAGRRWEGLPLTSIFIISMRNWTPNGTVKSNTGLLWGKKKGETKGHRGTETTNFYTRKCVFSFPRRCHDAPRFLHRTMFIFWYTCGVVVLYSTLSF